jgi:hypothetical protein
MSSLLGFFSVNVRCPKLLKFIFKNSNVPVIRRFHMADFGWRANQVQRLISLCLQNVFFFNFHFGGCSPAAPPHRPVPHCSAFISPLVMYVVSYHPGVQSFWSPGQCSFTATQCEDGNGRVIQLILQAACWGAPCHLYGIQWVPGKATRAWRRLPLLSEPGLTTGKPGQPYHYHLCTTQPCPPDLHRSVDRTFNSFSPERTYICHCAEHLSHLHPALPAAASSKQFCHKFLIKQKTCRTGCTVLHT